MNDPTKVPSKPDSLLISLKELRQIENHRITTEQLEQERLEHQQRAAAEEAEQQARQETERRQRKREEQDRSRRKAAEREDRLRLAEAERRARVEAEMTLERERFKLEMASTAGKTRGSGTWGTISIVLVVLLTGGLALSSYELHKHSGLQRVSELQIAHLKKIENGRSQSERALVLAQAKLRDQGYRIKQLQSRVESLSSRPDPSPRPKAIKRPKTKGTKKGSKPLINVVKCNPDDPICGIVDPKKVK
jgi:hypothetical protein